MACSCFHFVIYVLLNSLYSLLVSISTGRTTGANEYRFGYQGQFAEKDEEIGYNFFELWLWYGWL